MAPTPAMDFPSFPPIEIDIPDLADFRKFQEEFRIHKQKDAAWKASLESILKQNGISLTPPSSPATTVSKHAFTPPPQQSTAAEVTKTATATVVPAFTIVSYQSLSPSQWASHKDSEPVSVAASSQGHQVTDALPPLVPSAVSVSRSHHAGTGTNSGTDDNLLLSDIPSSFGQSDSDHDIDISEVFQYPPPEIDNENENENEIENNHDLLDELILPDMPRSSASSTVAVATTTTAPTTTTKSEAAVLHAKIMRGNYPDVSITTMTSGSSSRNGNGVTNQNINDMDLGNNPIQILPSQPLTLKDAGSNLGQIHRPNNNGGPGTGNGTGTGCSGSFLIQSVLSSPSGPTNNIWNELLDRRLLHTLGSGKATGTGGGPGPSHGHGTGFFPIHKMSPKSAPTTPTSQANSTPSRLLNLEEASRCSNSNSGRSAVSPNVSVHSSSSSRRRLLFRNPLTLKAVKCRLRNSGSSKKGFAYASNITAAATAAAVARSRNRQQDPEDTMPGYQKDQLEAMNHIETISQQCRNGSLRKIHRCTLCNYSNPRDKTVLMHIRMVHIGTDRRHPCPHCPFRFKNSSHLRKHVSRRHAEESMNGYGNRKTKNEVEFDLNKFDEEGEEIPSEGEGEDPLRDDGMNNYADDSYNEDEATILEDSQLREAWELFDGDSSSPRYLCLFCDSVYNDEATVVAHIRSSHKCRNCNETFQLEDRLKEHQEYCCISTANLGNSGNNGNPNNGHGHGHSVMVATMGSSNNNNPGHSRDPQNSSIPKKRRRSRSTSTTRVDKFGNIVKKKKRNNTLQYTFTEEMKQFLDPKIVNVKSSKPPYICSICSVTLNSTRQSARLHVRNVHCKDIKWLFQH